MDIRVDYQHCRTLEAHLRTLGRLCRPLAGIDDDVLIQKYSENGKFSLPRLDGTL